MKLLICVRFFGVIYRLVGLVSVCLSLMMWLRCSMVVVFFVRVGDSEIVR